MTRHCKIFSRRGTFANRDLAGDMQPLLSIPRPRDPQRPTGRQAGDQLRIGALRHLHHRAEFLRLRLPDRISGTLHSVNEEAVNRMAVVDDVGVGLRRREKALRCGPRGSHTGFSPGPGGTPNGC